MSRWWRAYDEAVDDPKLLLLSDKQHRAWFNLMCVASANGGVLPSEAVIGVKLRLAPAKVTAILSDLTAAGLLDKAGDGTFIPHNWNGRQYKSDVSTERVKTFRERSRNVKRNVSVTPPETENRKTETESNSEANASGADAPRDIRADLFDKGLKSLALMTGKTPDSCRSLVGRWLKSVNDEAIHVLGAIEDAERNRVADPVAWINKTLQPRQGNGRKTVQQASSDLLDKIRAFDEPAPGELRRGAGQADVRLLSPG